MDYVERSPRNDLRALVECFWAVTAPHEGRERPVETIVPDGCPELILHLGDPFERRQDGAPWIRQPRAFLAGTLSRPWTLRAGRRVLTLGIRFRPGAAVEVLRASMAELADRETALEDLLGPAAATLLAGTAAASSVDAALGAAEGWLGQWRSTRPSRPASSLPAIELILAARGQGGVAAVARSLGWSERRLQRAFAQDLGVSPKAFARIVRLNAALALLDPSRRTTAIDVAVRAGYFDQSHLLRDFRELTGGTPSRLADAAGELSHHLIRADRLERAFFAT